MYFLPLLCFIAISGPAQDTVQIAAQNIYSKVIREGTQRYLVYYKSDPDAPPSKMQLWTRNIERAVGPTDLPAFKIGMKWEYQDSLIHTVTTLCELSTMQPLSHEFWWKGTPVVNVDVQTKQVRINKFLSVADHDSSEKRDAIWSVLKTFVTNYVFSTHLEQEIFPLLPYKTGVTFIIPYSDPETGVILEKAFFTVTGEEELSGHDGQKIGCWIIRKTRVGNPERYWVSKKTGEVLRSEQHLKGTVYKYKLQLGF